MVSDPPVIPDELLPADGRFGCGPTKVRPAAVERLAQEAGALLGTSHRKPGVRSLVGRLQSGIAALFDLPDGYEVVLANGGATAFWESAVFCLVERRSLHYVFGEFSRKFAAAAGAAPWLDDPVRVEADVGSRPGLVGRDDVDVQALTHNETSTGVAMDVERPPGDALVVVDATSAAGGLPVDVRDTDVYYFSLQKGLGSEGGLTVALLSPAALDRIEQIRATGRYIPAFLDLHIAVTNGRKAQTYNTPSISTLFLAAEQVDWLNEQGGLQWAVAACAAKAEHVYRWADQAPYAAPFVGDPDARSSVVATVDLAGVDADEVQRVLRANGILDTDAYRKLGRNQIRVGVFPAVDHDDVVAYTRCVDWVVERLAA